MPRAGARARCARSTAARSPDTLFESTFFGHKQSAFTGAVEAQEGEVARDGGTLLLDEVGRLSAAGQASAHTCAITDRGELVCRGRGDSGQLGVTPRPLTPSGAPRTVSLTGWTATAGLERTCGVRHGTLLCRGNYPKGRRGIGGAAREIETPMPVAGAPLVAARGDDLVLEGQPGGSARRRRGGPGTSAREPVRVNW